MHRRLGWRAAGGPLVALATSLLISPLVSAQYTADHQTNTVDGVTSNWPGDYVVGSNTFADVLEITNGGVLSNGAGYVGYEAGSSNNYVRVTKSGSVWSNAAALYLGFGGRGNQLVVTNGGSVVSSNLYMGWSPSSINNYLVVTGSNSSWSTTGHAAIGGQGALDELSLNFGALFHSFTATAGDDASSSNNTIRVDGTGTVLSNAVRTVIGGSGRANQLVVTNGGTVASGAAIIGSNATAAANTVEVTGPGSVWNVSGVLTVGGYGGENALTIAAGGVVSNSIGYIGFGSSSSNNVVTILGNSSLWHNASTLVVGFGGSSNQLVISGGTVVAANGVIGAQPGAAGNVILVDGGELIITNAGFSAPLLVSGSGGEDTLVINGGSVRADHLVATNGANSVITFGGGNLSTRGTTISNLAGFVVGNGVSNATYRLVGGIHRFADGLTISGSGTLTGEGDIIGPITSAGIVAPGDSPGVLTILDSITFSNSATLDIELGGLPQAVSYDFLDVGTNAMLDGTLQLSFVGGFQNAVTASDVFTNLTAGISLLGAFDNVASGERLNTIDGYGSFLVTYADGNNLILSEWLAAVPEPSTMLLLVGGGLVMAGLYPRRLTLSAGRRWVSRARHGAKQTAGGRAGHTPKGRSPS